MCDCINKIEKERKEQFANILKKQKNLTLENVKFVDITFGLKKIDGGKNEMWMRTSSTVELQVKERKRPLKQVIVHNYCPFCGEKY